MDMTEDEKWMKIASQEANLAKSKGEVPVGSIIILNNQIIAKAHNSPISNYDPTAHAEILALRYASEKLHNYRLPETTLYVTLEPCAMCLGAMVHARIKQVVFGAYDSKSGVCGSCANLTSESFFNHKIEITGGVLEQDCKQVLKAFFKKRRYLNSITK